MGLEKAIKSGKEHRKPFKGAKAIDTSCRNNGGKTKRRAHRECPWCKGNRLYSNTIKEASSKEQLSEEINE